MLCPAAQAQTQARTEEEQLRKALETGEIIRLHVVAAGDDDESQAIKLKVRDKVLSAWRDKLAGKKDAGDMMDYLNENIQALKDAAQAAARDEGYYGPVTVQTGVFSFPDRWYGGVLVPAGDYQALRIVLGEGEGHNWWCVLFPSLCLSLAATDAPPAEAQVADASQDADFTWWTWKVFSSWPLFAPV
jgi:stage II sporulation protein R